MPTLSPRFGRRCQLVATMRPSARSEMGSVSTLAARRSSERRVRTSSPLLRSSVMRRVKRSATRSVPSVAIPSRKIPRYSPGPLPARPSRRINCPSGPSTKSPVRWATTTSDSATKRASMNPASSALASASVEKTTSVVQTGRRRSSAGAMRTTRTPEESETATPPETREDAGLQARAVAPIAPIAMGTSQCLSRCDTQVLSAILVRRTGSASASAAPIPRTCA
jgi:hypothetical protein